MIYVNSLPFSSIDHALFQAKMWRDYANAFNGPTHALSQAAWITQVMKMNKEQCIERARIALQAARMFNELR